MTKNNNNNNNNNNEKNSSINNAFKNNIEDTRTMQTTRSTQNKTLEPHKQRVQSQNWRHYNDANNALKSTLKTTEPQRQCIQSQHWRH